MRTYYTITDAGRQALAEARQQIRELVDEVLEGQGPTQLATPAELDDVDADEE